MENVNEPVAVWVEFHSTGFPLLSLIPNGPRGVVYVNVPLYVWEPVAPLVVPVVNVNVVVFNALVVVTVPMVCVVLVPALPGAARTSAYAPAPAAATMITRIITSTTVAIPGRCFVFKMSFTFPSNGIGSPFRRYQALFGLAAEAGVEPWPKVDVRVGASLWHFDSRLVCSSYLTLSS